MRTRTYQNSYAGLVALSSQPTTWIWAAIGILVLALIAIGVAIFIFWIARKNTAAAAIAGHLADVREFQQ